MGEEESIICNKIKTENKFHSTIDFKFNVIVDLIHYWDVKPFKLIYEKKKVVFYHNRMLLAEFILKLNDKFTRRKSVKYKDGDPLNCSLDNLYQ